MSTLQPDLIQRTKWLTQILLISGALNFGFMAIFVYFVLQEKQTALTFDLEPARLSFPLSNQDLLRSYSTLSFQELLLRLEEKELIEEGFVKRDLALSCLVAFHHFDIEKALGGHNIQKRKIAFSSQDGSESMTLLLFPELTEAQYLAISQFAAVEKWPFTSRGLFYEIQRARLPIDAALLDTFFLTREFEAVYLLFSRAAASVDKQTLLTLLLEGNWPMLEKFVEEQKRAQDLTAIKRVTFLIDYLKLRSQLAAKLLLETEFEWVCKRLDNLHTLLLLELLVEHTPTVEKFAKVLLISPRSDAVWKKASFKLFSFAGEAPIDPFNHELVLKRFIPQALTRREVAPEPIKVAPPKWRVHRVEEGDNLWKIAKKYHVSIDALMLINHLESEKLRPGKELHIPD